VRPASWVPRDGPVRRACVGPDGSQGPAGDKGATGASGVTADSSVVTRIVCGKVD